ncbi:unnamed protein product [Nippostrongylus brasiliensis]|uniref:Craniofacial development protein 2 n=1 Tax=Nippostrongylus brasiliensis TaxID=27835 RepID=A0A0N4XVN9_NIPBR|nr:unnamed protein product [Nippostrongylus brasiliensis]
MVVVAGDLNGHVSISKVDSNAMRFRLRNTKRGRWYEHVLRACYDTVCKMGPTLDVPGTRMASENWQSGPCFKAGKTLKKKKKKKKKRSR